MDLGEGLRQAIAKLTKATIIDAKTIREFNKELQKTLLSADVEVKLVLNFTKEIEEQALKSKPPAGLSSKDYITNIVYEELVKLVGPTYVPEMKKQRIPRNPNTPLKRRALMIFWSLGGGVKKRKGIKATT